MEVFKAESQEILKRYAEGRISRKQCIDALDGDATVAAIHYLTPGQLKEFQTALAANDASVRAHVRRVQ